MSKRLAVSVTVYDEDTGRSTTYQAGDEVADEHVDLITNPDVWETEPDEVLVVPGPSQFGRGVFPEFDPSEVPMPPAKLDGEGGEEGDDLDSMKKDDLLDVAAARGVEVSSSATKAEIIEALRAAE